MYFPFKREVCFPSSFPSLLSSLLSSFLFSSFLPLFFLQSMFFNLSERRGCSWGTHFIWENVLTEVNMKLEAWQCIIGNILLLNLGRTLSPFLSCGIGCGSLVLWARKRGSSVSLRKVCYKKVEYSAAGSVLAFPSVSPRPSAAFEDYFWDRLFTNSFSKRSLTTCIVCQALGTQRQMRQDSSSET